MIQFYDLNLEKGESLVAHFDKMKGLTTQLVGVKVNMKEDECIFILLKTLPQEEHGAIAPALTNPPSPKLVDVVGSLVEEEKKLKK